MGWKTVFIAMCLAVLPQAVFAQNKTHQLRRFAVGEQVIRMTYVQHLDVDCTPMGKIRMIIIRAPENGTVKSEEIQVLSSFEKDNPRFICNEKRTPALNFSYQAKEGFKGDDRFTFAAVFYDGTVWRYDAVITVY